jgi:molybdate transport system substrate-binding protein
LYPVVYNAWDFTTIEMDTMLEFGRCHRFARRLARARSGLTALVWLAFSCVGVALSDQSARAEEPAPLTVLAASSLQGVLDRINVAFEKAQGTKTRAAYAASSALARQIEQGAPADVFISADAQWMDVLATAKLIDPASRRSVAGNRLVWIAAAGTAADLSKPTAAQLTSMLSNGRLAVCDLASCPAGRYAKAALEHYGLMPAVEGKLAVAENVRAALAFVARGESPLGIVYETDAVAQPAVRIAGLIPDSAHPPIIYPAARVSASSHPGTMTYLDYLKSSDARAIFAAAGFRLAD